MSKVRYWDNSPKLHLHTFHIRLSLCPTSLGNYQEWNLYYSDKDKYSSKSSLPSSSLTLLTTTFTTITPLLHLHFLHLSLRLDKFYGLTHTQPGEEERKLTRWLILNTWPPHENEAYKTSKIHENIPKSAILYRFNTSGTPYPSLPSSTTPFPPQEGPQRHAWPPPHHPTRASGYQHKQTPR